MNIVKLFILNMILLYFLKYDKKYVYILFFIMISYSMILYYKNTIEGYTNTNNDIKRKVRFVEMLEINNLMDRLVHMLEDSEKNCVGKYSEYSSCDKKCGKSYKSKRYRILQRAGLYGRDCVEEDGFIKKEKCDVNNDGIYPCTLGQTCTENEDCETANCNPLSKVCEESSKCSETKLHVCNKLECNNLHKKNASYIWDQKKLICRKKKEDEKGDGLYKFKKDDNNNNNNDDNDDGISYVEPTKPCEWYQREGKMTTNKQKQCVNRSKEASSIVWLEQTELTERNSIMSMTLVPGLYCKLGRRASEADPELGSSTPILENNINDKLGWDDICNTCVEGLDPGKGLDLECKKCATPGMWPAVDDFKTGFVKTDKIPFTKICKLCDNGWRYNNDDGTCQICDNGGKYTNQYNPVKTGGSIKTFISDPGVNPECSEIEQAPSDINSCEHVICLNNTVKVESGVPGQCGGDDSPCNEFCCVKPQQYVYSMDERRSWAGGPPETGEVWPAEHPSNINLCEPGLLLDKSKLSGDVYHDGVEYCISCKAKGPRRYSASYNSNTCDTCELGRLVGVTNCTDCLEGQITSPNDPKQCVPCQTLLNQRVDGAKCTSCSYSDGGELACTRWECPTGYYSEQQGSEFECRPIGGYCGGVTRGPIATRTEQLPIGTGATWEAYEIKGSPLSQEVSIRPVEPAPSPSDYRIGACENITTYTGGALYPRNATCEKSYECRGDECTECRYVAEHGGDNWDRWEGGCAGKYYDELQKYYNWRAGSEGRAGGWQGEGAMPKCRRPPRTLPDSALYTKSSGGFDALSDIQVANYHLLNPVGGGGGWHGW